MTNRPANAHRAAPVPSGGASSARLVGGGTGAARRHRRAVAASLVAFVIATEAVTQTATTFPPCYNPVPNADALLEPAIAEGYTVVRVNEGLDPETVDRLQWILAEPYLVGDTGGETLETIVARANKNARQLSGITPTAKTAVRVVHSDQTVAILRWWTDAAGDISVHCSGALFLGDDFSPPPTTGRYGDFSATPVDTGIPGLEIVSERFQLDRAAIRAELPEATPPHYIMGVQMRYNPEVIQ